ncbi:DUF5615 family PIN-like protein [Gemmatimonas sp.]|uniref:DUF5615 family PIN-like protein n=1 Tax=Gemmatimonas sp. TaxID=1962908 RepID=UPI003DA23922
MAPASTIATTVTAASDVRIADPRLTRNTTLDESPSSRIRSALSVPPDSAVLAEQGWDGHDGHEEGLAGELDTVIRTVCEQEERILVTLDTDFADVRFVDPLISPGVILSRPPDQSIHATVSCLSGAVRLLCLARPRGE